MESIIFSVDEINKVNFNEVIQTLQTLVYSINKDKTYVSWSSTTPPSFINDLNTAEGPYDQNQLLIILSTPTWLVLV